MLLLASACNAGHSPLNGLLLRLHARRAECDHRGSGYFSLAKKNIFEVSKIFKINRKNKKNPENWKTLKMLTKND
jgi:hypothetical protein